MHGAVELHHSAPPRPTTTTPATTTTTQRTYLRPQVKSLDSNAGDDYYDYSYEYEDENEGVQLAENHLDVGAYQPAPVPVVVPPALPDTALPPPGAAGARGAGSSGTGEGGDFISSFFPLFLIMGPEINNFVLYAEPFPSDILQELESYLENETKK